MRRRVLYGEVSSGSSCRSGAGNQVSTQPVQYPSTGKEDYTQQNEAHGAAQLVEHAGEIKCDQVNGENRRTIIDEELAIFRYAPVAEGAGTEGDPHIQEKIRLQVAPAADDSKAKHPGCGNKHRQGALFAGNHGNRQ